jgi:hypothetical protein
MNKLFQSILACLAILVVSSGAHAEIMTLTFDELAPDTPANGASVNGVHFGFSGPNADDAFYNSSTLIVGPEDAVNLSRSVLEGDSAGVLTIDFSTLTDVLRFAVMLSTTDVLNPGFSVELFDGSLSSLGTFEVLTTPLTEFGFSELDFCRFFGLRGVSRLGAMEGRD